MDEDERFALPTRVDNKEKAAGRSISQRQVYRSPFENLISQNYSERPGRC